MYTNSAISINIASTLPLISSFLQNYYYYTIIGMLAHSERSSTFFRKILEIKVAYVKVKRRLVHNWIPFHLFWII